MPNRLESANIDVDEISEVPIATSIINNAKFS